MLPETAFSFHPVSTALSLDAWGCCEMAHPSELMLPLCHLQQVSSGRRILILWKKSFARPHVLKNPSPRDTNVWIVSAIVLLISTMAHAQELPPGTVIPVMLASSVNASKGSDKKIEGRVMQEISSPSGVVIRERSPITGHVVNASNAGLSQSRLVLKFDAIESGGRLIRVTTALIALASMMSVSHAQSPINSTSNMDSMSQWVTRQIGGDVVYRGRGKAKSATGEVGKWVEGTSVLIKLTPNPNAGCSSGPGYDREQAVWVFSSAACGAYDLKDVKIANSGATEPLGEIVLTSSHDIAIRGGSGWLLITVPTN
jgi:hypothetical protein